MQKPVTIKTIAKELGLSLSSVSKALNDYPDISYETKKLVSDKAIELGYTPNLFAVNLVKNTSNSIGVILRDANTVYGELIKPLSNAAREYNLNIILADSNRDISEENKCLQTMLESRVQIIIIAPVNNDYERIRSIVADRIPVIFLGKAMANSGLCYVAVDSRAEALLALRYLFSKGHREIALIGDSRLSNSTKIKVATYEEFMKSQKIKPAVFMDSELTHSLIDSGYYQARKMLLEKRPFSAIFAVKDDVAIGVLKALREEGKKVPDDISVIGCDGSLVSGNPLIELTTVGWNMDEVSKEIIDLIVSQKNKISEPYLAKPYLIERKSCGSPQINKDKVH